MKTYEQLKATPVEKLDRIEAIEVLRYMAHPSTFHQLLSWSTAHLKALISYYRESDKEDRIIASPRDARRVPVLCACGNHWGHTGKHYPTGPRSITIEIVHTRRG